MKPISEMTDRELDEAVAREVMGWAPSDDPMPVCPECKESVMRPKCMWELGGDCPRHEVRREWEAGKRPEPYSTQIDAAWQVFSKFDNISIERKVERKANRDDGEFRCVIKIIGISVDDTEYYSAYATTAAKAICQCALLAVRRGVRAEVGK
jgi:hypothetical protein